MHYTLRTKLVWGPYHKLSTKWAQSIKKMGCNMFFNAKSVALADDANLKNFWLIGFGLRVHLESWPCTIHLEQTFLGPIPQTEHKIGAMYQKNGL